MALSILEQKFSDINKHPGLNNRPGMDKCTNLHFNSNFPFNSRFENFEKKYFEICLDEIFPKINKNPAPNKDVLGGKLSKNYKNVLDNY